MPYIWQSSNWCCCRCHHCRAGIVNQLVYHVGELALPAAAWQLRSWRLLALVCCAACLLAAAGAAACHESPRWLLVSGKGQHAHDVLSWLAQRNGQSLPDGLGMALAVSSSSGDEGERDDQEAALAMLVQPAVLTGSKAGRQQHARSDWRDAGCTAAAAAQPHAAWFGAEGAAAVSSAPLRVRDAPWEIALWGMSDGDQCDQFDGICSIATCSPATPGTRATAAAVAALTTTPAAGSAGEGRQPSAAPPPLCAAPATAGPACACPKRGSPAWEQHHPWRALLSRRATLVRLAASCGLNFILANGFFVLSLAAEQLAGSLYTNFAVTSLLEAPLAAAAMIGVRSCSGGLAGCRHEQFAGSASGSGCHDRGVFIYVVGCSGGLAACWHDQSARGASGGGSCVWGAFMWSPTLVIICTLSHALRPCACIQPFTQPTKCLAPYLPPCCDCPAGYPSGGQPRAQGNAAASDCGDECRLLRLLCTSTRAGTGGGWTALGAV